MTFVSEGNDLDPAFTRKVRLLNTTRRKWNLHVYYHSANKKPIDKNWPLPSLKKSFKQRKPLSSYLIASMAAHSLQCDCFSKRSEAVGEVINKWTLALESRLGGGRTCESSGALRMEGCVPGPYLLWRSAEGSSRLRGKSNGVEGETEDERRDRPMDERARKSKCLLKIL